MSPCPHPAAETVLGTDNTPYCCGFQTSHTRVCDESQLPYKGWPNEASTLSLVSLPQPIFLTSWEAEISQDP